ncbi:MAG: aminopeptidase [Lachnospiraceae bacterium]|nr:aminopeptidase [Lachnospiraceae bacterium]
MRMDYGDFLLGLLAVSTLTGLVTEAVKKLLRELGKNPPPNLLAGIVAVVLAVAVSAGYLVLSGTAFRAGAAVYVLALVFLSWLAAMVGYDKVVQALAQLGQHRKG